MLETTAAILPGRDFDETSEFYQKIGFKETGRWGMRETSLLDPNSNLLRIGQFL